MKKNTARKGRSSPASLSAPETPSVLTTLTNLERDESRLRQDLIDPVTALPLLPVLHSDYDLLFDHYPHLGLVYLQTGKFSGLESAYGWELFDEILRTSAYALRDWSAAGEWHDRLVSLHFNGVDGFYFLVNLSEVASETPHLILELIGHQLRDLLYDALSKKFGASVIDLLGIYHSSLKLDPDPQVRISRLLHRAFKETSRSVSRAENKEKNSLEQEFRNIITHRRVRTVFQPIFHLPKQQRVGFEGLSRGPEGSIFESPDTMFAAARDNSLLMELESICQASALEALVQMKPPGRIFLNTSSNFISHPVFTKRLKEPAMKKMAPSLVLEITEKEAIQNYHDFRKDIEPLRKAGIRIAVDDAGSGYADLESIAEVKPDYIKIANSITRRVAYDLIKQEIISTFLNLGRKLKSTVIAEGIENREDFQVLKRLGVEYGQGYFLGRPAELTSSR
ncbi:MAG: EAL domain-containing protein [Acidobacteriia bacterium]|nr:EAL domain-containing protein [Terriglobia bacterium]